MVLFEAATRLGGKILTTPFAGRLVDEGADAFLARVPAGVELCRELGIDGDLVAPATGAAYVWTGGRLAGLPAGLVLGVPTDLDALAASGIVEPRRRGPAPRPTSIATGTTARRATSRSARWCGARLGDEVHERLVDPLVGEHQRGRHRPRSACGRSTPMLAAAADASPSLDRRARSATARRPGPVFSAPRGGMGVIVVCAGRGAARRRPLRRPRRTAASDAGCGRRHRREAPAAAPRTRRLVAPVSADAAALLGGDRVRVGGAGDPGVRGARRPDARSTAAASSSPAARGCSSRRARGPAASGPTSPATAPWCCGLAGRPGRPHRLDDDLSQLLDDLAATMGITATPRHVRVHEWAHSFPQYAPGHLERADAIDAGFGEGRAPESSSPARRCGAWACPRASSRGGPPPAGSSPA